MANPVPFDPTLPTCIKDELKMARHQGRIAFLWLSKQNLGQFDIEFEAYKLAIKKYLKIVSLELYVYLNHALKDDPRSQQFLRFQQYTQGLNQRIANYLNQRPASRLENISELKSIIIRLDHLLVVRNRDEQKILWPMYGLSQLNSH
ncbi:MAG: hypothetical protein WBM41_03180 [Arenicellales bacterium]